MIEQEQWNFGSATARVFRCSGLTVELRGVLTAQVYEALHMRLACERSSGPRALIIDWPSMITVTSRSAVEAALRGTPAGRKPAHVDLVVPRTRLQWAERHCQLMTEHGLPRAALAILDPARARLSA